jgi:Protein of unknown function (DUF1572)
MALEFTTSYVKDSISILRYYKRLGDGAMSRVSDVDLGVTLDPESNSIAIIVKHLSGNMCSRWKDFLTSDGEKAFRNRAAEFEAPPQTRAEVTEMWEAGWKYVFEAMESLTDADLGRTVLIRNEPHSVMQAINRQIAHYAYHVGQILFVAKHLCGARWKSLSIPRGKSADYNDRVSTGRASQR